MRSRFGWKSSVKTRADEIRTSIAMPSLSSCRSSFPRVCVARLIVRVTVASEHEAPRLTLSSTDILEEGMVFSIEPGIYISRWGGVRIEDLAVLERGRCRFLSHAPKIVAK